MIVIGGRKYRDSKLDKLLQTIGKQKNVVILKESISNLYGNDFIDQIDANVEIINERNLQEFCPDLVLSFGAGVVSKKLKFWLRKQEDIEHWHLTNSFEHWDIFQGLSKVLQLDTITFFEKMRASKFTGSSNYRKNWLALNARTQGLLKAYLENLDFNDFSVFDFLIRKMKSDVLLQLGNSTPVRYVNLLALDGDKNLTVNSNRGVSGIDGILSTAVGASLANPEKLCFCICGDIASLYDSNALLNNLDKANLRLIIINNGGGNIFRIIPGPDKLTELEEFFETKHPVSFEDLAKTYSCTYFSADSFSSLEQSFTKFIAPSEQACILEIKTAGKPSADALRAYFSYLLKNIELN